MPDPVEIHVTELLQVVESSGLDLLASRSLNANVGVSFSKTRYFSKKMMAYYIQWGMRHFDKLLIIVADHLEAYNAQVFKGLSYEEACRRSLEVGEQLRTSYVRSIPADVGSRVSVKLASELIQEVECSALITRINNLTSNHSSFKADLYTSVSEALSDKLAEAKVKGLEGNAIETLANYLIEELAIVLYLSHLAPSLYPVMVVPHFIPSILPKLYGNGPYASLFSDVTSGQPFRSLKLVEAANKELHT